MTAKPIHLTDPDDPRIKPGAKVRWVCEWTLSSDVRPNIFDEYSTEWLQRDIKNADPHEKYYLIAEADES